MNGFEVVDVIMRCDVDYIKMLEWANLYKELYWLISLRSR